MNSEIGPMMIELGETTIRKEMNMRLTKFNVRNNIGNNLKQ